MSSPHPCLHCGLLPYATRPRATRPCQDEVSVLTEDIHQIDNAILRLKEQKAAIFHRLNAARAPTRNLPDEILSAIFELAAGLNTTPPLMLTRNPTVADHLLDDPHQRYFPLCVLGGVCSHWRKVAWSTQSLWSRLDLDIIEKPLLKHDFALPDVYFHNSGCRPITVMVDCRKVQQRNWAFTDPLDPLRLERLSKIAYTVFAILSSVRIPTG
jgi:hypothetical protein